ncbi:MAG: regulator SirB [Burkholderiales bacterium]|nr:MAG: regulator SirB [Burkholderiales bacterium]
MIDFYPQTRLAHIGLVVTSGTLFALRGVATLAGARWSSVAPLRYASYLIDTALLSAALLLLAMLRINPFVEPWLAVKLALLPVYVVLGVMALRRARSPRSRIAYFVAALVCFGSMYSIARAHHPLGFLGPLLV